MGNKKKVDDSDEDQQISDSATPASTQNSKGKNHLNEDKRKKAQQVHANQLSASYVYFDPPHLSDSLNEHGQRMLAYPSVVKIPTGQLTIAPQPIYLNM
ncbi:hypothetical protein PSTG_06767 [Puccinia striiformis f. sp. tritici PST-78]|uniref:Uncharacterized protein n=1 Tax=Puccinia striiformis f. sp. tritici PST-78 TaxID=1165861 RepID=A0A0L0VLP0_9BASI|nr:hypothetical protein PSTG_06767 [Puccinia striiformis f. sp. tritici PST-78]